MFRALPLIIILVVGAFVLIFFIVRSLLFPQHAESLPGLIKTGRTQAAIRAAKRIIAKNPRNAEARYCLGLAYHREKREELALAELKTVLNLGIKEKNIPEVEFRELLAQLYAGQNEGEEALKEYLLLIKLIPTHADYYYQAGKLFNERNKTDMAARCLGKAAELNPRDGNIHCELGIILYKEKKAQEANAALNVALKHLRENQERAHYYLGKIKKDAKDYAAAAESFEKAARSGEFKVRALVEKGGCHLAQGAADRALADLEQAVQAITDESSPESLYARYFLGNCYESVKEMDKAIAQWDKVYAKKKNFRDVGEKLIRYQQYRSAAPAQRA
ncbi:MAG: tetratricopeptide repeat protein [Treponema sp.]|jgi:tetratricopeptide (TPR) repeat protein|nr:tetratricopeptide repeat protein [Treponema sp.]